MAYPSEYYTKAQEIIDKRRFENSVKAEKRLREVRSKIPEIVEIDSKLSKTIDELVKIILSDKPDKKQRIEQVKEENLALQEQMCIRDSPCLLQVCPYRDCRTECR